LARRATGSKNTLIRRSRSVLVDMNHITALVAELASRQRA